MEEPITIDHVGPYSPFYYVEKIEYFYYAASKSSMLPFACNLK